MRSFNPYKKYLHHKSKRTDLRFCSKMPRMNIFPLFSEWHHGRNYYIPLKNSALYSNFKKFGHIRCVVVTLQQTDDLITAIVDSQIYCLWMVNFTTCHAGGWPAFVQSGHPEKLCCLVCLPVMFRGKFPINQSDQQTNQNKSVRTGGILTVCTCQEHYPLAKIKIKIFSNNYMRMLNFWKHYKGFQKVKC